MHGKINVESLCEQPKYPPWALKLTTAITGVLFGLSVIVHILGNLEILAGKEDFSACATSLRTIGVPTVPNESVLWTLHIVLLVAIVLHTFSGLILVARAKRSRGKFRRQGMVSSWNTFTTRSMVIIGIALLTFIIFHLLDLTIGTGVAPFAFKHGEAHQNVVAPFSRPGVVAWYITTQLALLPHLSHGLWTATFDLGITGKRWHKVLLFLFGLLPPLVAIDNISIPVAALTGLVLQVKGEIYYDQH